jgi:hypothetical protein
MGLCVTSAGSSATVHCGGPGASATDDAVATITAISGNNVTVMPASSSAPASGAMVYHDETLAARACANLATISNEQQCEWPQGTYNLDAPLASCGAGDITAEVCMPVIDTTLAYTANPATAVEMTSAGRPSLLNITTSPTPGVVFQTDNSTTATGSALIGCEGSHSGGATSKLTNVTFVSYGVEYLVPGNGIAALMLKYCTGVNLQNFVITGPQQGTQYASAPSNASSWGLEMPFSPQGGLAYVQNGRIDGFFNGIAYFEGADVSGIVVGYCVNCILAGTNAAALQHESLMGMVQVAFGVNVLGSVDNEFGTSAINAPVHIEDLNIEHDASPSWAQTTCDICDSSNKLEGVVFYKVSDANGSGNNLTLSGGKNLKSFNLQSGEFSNINLGNQTWGQIYTTNTTTPLGANIDANFQDDLFGFKFQVNVPTSYTTGGSGSTSGFYSLGVPNFTGRQFIVREFDAIPCVTASATVVYPTIIMGTSSSADLQVYIFSDATHGCNVYVLKNGSTVIGATNGVTYSPTNMSNFRICESGGNLTVDYAADGYLYTATCGTTGSWTSLGTTADFTLTSGVQLVVGVNSTASGSTGAQPGYVQFDHIRIQ